ncbi:MAG: DUF3134 domain-containing protein [Spirirestis rafaelensis WJT71-NPBG6]|jgi:hypothetical protein|nr:DUF3134 domain-containing protein [Tolypothrix sp. Co-bin9]MBW4447414.1 DUF3134 domain-containing protein [Spirirestis rafaelensis WJT71-NPBG6]
MLNSPLREEPRNQRAAVIPLKQESSLLDWLHSNNRLIAREVQEAEFSSGEDDVEALMGVEDGGIDYDIDDDDDIVVEED